MQIIGIGRESETGKSTVAGFLAAELDSLGFSVSIDSIAAPIKQIAREKHGWNGVKDDRWRMIMAEIYDEAVEETGNQNYWTDRLMSRYSGEYIPQFLIVPDVRRKVEAEFVREAGVLWLVYGRYGKLGGEAMKYENEIMQWPHYPEDIVLQNDAGLNELHGMIRAMVACNRHVIPEVVGL